MNKLILSALVAASFSAQAADIQNIGDWSKAESVLIAGYASHHLNSENHKYLNETNPAIGFEAWDIQAVYMDKNSWSEQSLYLTYAPDYEVNKFITVSGQVGIATGYKCSNSVTRGDFTLYNGSNTCNDSGVIPMLAATITFKPTGKGFGVSFSVNPSVAMFSVNYEL